MSKAIANAKPTNFITYNPDADNYVWWDEINHQLTVYRIVVNDTTVVVNIYQSPIMQQNKQKALNNIEWRKQETYGREYIRIISEQLNRVTS